MLDDTARPSSPERSASCHTRPASAMTVTGVADDSPDEHAPLLTPSPPAPLSGGWLSLRVLLVDHDQRRRSHCTRGAALDIEAIAKTPGRDINGLP
jgi:hypothetical protein